jgi:MoaA/NifB/PqqE/SkfB family radical SAM enzyme
MDARRLKLLPLALYKLKYLWHWLAGRRDVANAYSYVWATLFTRDAGLALMDPLIRRWPWLAGYPKQMEIEVTTHCNLRCAMCEHTYWEEPSRHMSFAEYKHIVDQFPKLKWIGMTGIGSSFLNDDYMDMIRYMKRERKAFVEFFDPFHMFDEDKARECIELGVNKIWVSLEYARRDTYESFRKGAKFDIVMENLWNLVRLKREMKSPIPELWFHFIINKHNVSEMKEYVDLVAQVAEYERGFSAPLVYWTNMLAFDEVSDIATQPAEEWIEEVKAYCGEKRLFHVFNENIVSKAPMSHCTHWTEPFVLATGHIQPCCALNEANTREWQKAKAFTNLLEEDFRDWWASERRKEFIDALRSGGINDICRYCHIYPHPDSYRFRAQQQPADVAAARDRAAEEVRP